MYVRRRASAAGVIGLLALLMAILVGGCGEPVATAEPVYFKAAGAMAMEPLVSELAQAFHESNPTIGLEVSGPGTHYGLQALDAGEVDLALVSWLPADLSPDWQAVAIGRDGIALLVHPGNPVDGLGLLQLQDLFGGWADHWTAVGGRADQGMVQPVSRELGSGTGTAFEALVMGDRRVTPLAVVAPSPQGVVDYVAGNTDAIGYASMSVVDGQVKALKVEGVLPTPESTSQGIYPLSRELWLVTARPPAKELQAFLDFVLSPAGQQIVGRRHGRVR
jgi:phosphate transport system substrate-binding protein